MRHRTSKLKYCSKPLPDEIGVFWATISSSGKFAYRSEKRHLKTEDLVRKIKDKSLLKVGEPPKASLALLFFPTEYWREICDTPSDVRAIFEYLNFDLMMLEYAMSNRSGWYYLETQEGRGTYMFKDSLYMLLWSWNAATLETRALIYERSDYKTRSCLKKIESGKELFHLPGLKPCHLYHPLSLAVSRR